MLTKVLRHLQYIMFVLALAAMPTAAQEALHIPLPQRVATEHRLILEGTLELEGGPMPEIGLFYREALIRVVWGELDRGILPFRVRFEMQDDRMETTIPGASMTPFPETVRGIVRVEPGQSVQVEIIDVLPLDQRSLVEDVIQAFIVPQPAAAVEAGDTWVTEDEINANLTFSAGVWFPVEDRHTLVAVQNEVARIETARDGSAAFGEGAAAPPGERLHYRAASTVRAAREIDLATGVTLSFTMDDQLEERVASYERSTTAPDILFAASMRVKLRMEVGSMAAIDDSAELPKRPLQIVMAPWISSDPLAYTAKVMLEEYFDEEVVVWVAPIETAWELVAKGEVDLFFDAWLPNLHAEEILRYADQIEVLGTAIVEMLELGWAVPAYVPIDSVIELNDHVEAFGGRIIGLDPDSGMMKRSAEVIETYGLNYELVPGSELDLLTAINEAVQKGEWIVFLAYRPHYKFVQYDLKMLEDPAGHWPFDDIVPVARRGFQEDYPEIAAFLGQWELSLRDYELLIHQIEVLGRHPALAARDWLNARRDLVESWLSTE